jgi:hypothetical protein
MLCYVDMTRMAALMEEAYTVRDSWFKDLPNRMALLDRHMWTFFFRDALVARELFSRVIGPAHRKIVIFDGAAPALWQKPNDTPDAIWRYMADARSLSVATIPSPAVAPVVSSAGFRAPIRKMLRAVKKRIERRKLPRRSILFIAAPRAETERYSGICQALQRQLGTRFIGMSTYDGPGKTPYAYVPLPPMLPPAPGITTGAESARIWEQLAAGRDYPEIFRNPYLAFHFEHYFNVRWPELRTLGARFKRLLMELEPECVIVTDIPFDKQNVFADAANELNIPTCSLPHSVTPTVERVRIHTSVAVGWTTNYRTVLRAEGSTRPVVVAGIPQSILSEPASSGMNIAPQGRKSITVLSSLTKVGLLPNVDQRAYAQTLEALVNVPESLRGSVRLIWKCHPYFDHYKAIEHLIQKHGSEDIVLLRTSGSLHDYIAECDLAVATIPTAGCLYPLLQKKPFIFLNTSQLLHPSPYIPGRPSPSLISDPEETWKRLEQALFDQDTQSAILKENRRTLDQLSPTPQTISDDEAAAHIIRGIKEACSLASNF